MAVELGKELGALPSAGALSGSTLVYIVDSDGNSRKVPLSALKAFFNTDPTVVPSSVPWRGARVRRTSDQSIPSTVPTIVAWNAADIDTNSIWSAGAPTRLTVPTGVTKVRLRAGARWAANGSSTRQLYMAKNGAAFQGRGSSFFGAGASSNHEGNASSAVISVVAGDYFEMGVTQNSGGALALMAYESTWFEMEVVEATV